MEEPDRDDLRLIEESYDRLVDRSVRLARRTGDDRATRDARRDKAVHRQALSEIISLRATSALRRACMLEDVDAEHVDRTPTTSGATSDHRLRASDGPSHMDTVRMGPGSAGRCISELAAAIIQRRALIVYISSRRGAGCAADGRGWSDAQLVHPAAFLMEQATGSTGRSGRGTTSTSRILRGVETSDGTVARRIFLDEGSPDVAWADRRPTRVGFEMEMPETLVSALAGRRLSDVMSPTLPAHQADAYSRLVIAYARMAGSRDNPRVDMMLEPVPQTTRGPRPDDATVDMGNAWDGILRSAQAT